MTVVCVQLSAIFYFGGIARFGYEVISEPSDPPSLYSYTQQQKLFLVDNRINASISGWQDRNHLYCNWLLFLASQFHVKNRKTC